MSAPLPPQADDSPLPAPVVGFAPTSAARLRAEVAARLAPVCASMERRHFERLVEDVTAFTLRWSADTAVNAYGVTSRAD
jgi:hypothetical protein